MFGLGKNKRKKREPQLFNLAGTWPSRIIMPEYNTGPFWILYTDEQRGKIRCEGPIFNFYEIESCIKEANLPYAIFKIEAESAEDAIQKIVAWIDSHKGSMSS